MSTTVPSCEEKSPSFRGIRNRDTGLFRSRLADNKNDGPGSKADYDLLAMKTERARKACSECQLRPLNARRRTRLLNHLIALCDPARLPAHGARPFRSRQKKGRQNVLRPRKTREEEDQFRVSTGLSESTKRRIALSVSCGKRRMPAPPSP
jgi:hypothetical protein